jgi:hypothetical protein
VIVEVQSKGVRAGRLPPDRDVLWFVEAPLPAATSGGTGAPLSENWPVATIVPSAKLVSTPGQS